MLTKKDGIMRTNNNDIQISQASNDVSITDRMLYVNETKLSVSEGFSKTTVNIIEIEMRKSYDMNRK